MKRRLPRCPMLTGAALLARACGGEEVFELPDLRVPRRPCFGDRVGNPPAIGAQAECSDVSVHETELAGGTPIQRNPPKLVALFLVSEALPGEERAAVRRPYNANDRLPFVQ